MKIVTVVGARPQFIKMAPLSRVLREEHSETVIHTGQHYDYEMSELFFNQLKIPEPDHNLGIRAATHGQQTGRMLAKLEDVITEEQPDLLMVHGDTNSTLAAALAGAKMGVPVGHVEAGLRSFDREMPEEINRVVVDHISQLLFVPTSAGMNNLKREGLEDKAYLCGDVMYDSLIYNLEIAKGSDILEREGLGPGEYMLATCHRPSNTDDTGNLAMILEAFSESGEEIIFPVHPRTRKFIAEHKLEDRIEDNVKVIDPVGYLDFIWLEKNAAKILTDSGGIQKEAYILKVPCVTLRENTEWIETVEDGWNMLVGARKDRILGAIRDFGPSGEQRRAYGDGRASEKILRAIDEFYR